MTADALDVILRHGPLSRRILGQLRDVADSDFGQAMRAVYRNLMDCLADGVSFNGARLE